MSKLVKIPYYKVFRNIMGRLHHVVSVIVTELTNYILYLDVFVNVPEYFIDSPFLRFSRRNGLSIK